MTDFRCTYRIQLTEAFGFRAAREVVAEVVDPDHVAAQLVGADEVL